jgi:hypothetical protein
MTVRGLHVGTQRISEADLGDKQGRTPTQTVRSHTWWEQP